MDLTVLNNGASVVASERTSKDGGVVLALFHGEYVTWNVSNDGDAYTGHYFSDIIKATADFSERAGLVVS